MSHSVNKRLTSEDPLRFYNAVPSAVIFCWAKNGGLSHRSSGSILASLWQGQRDSQSLRHFGNASSRQDVVAIRLQDFCDGSLGSHKLLPLRNRPARKQAAVNRCLDNYSDRPRTTNTWKGERVSRPERTVRHRKSLKKELNETAIYAVIAFEAPAILTASLII